MYAKLIAEGHTQWWWGWKTPTQFQAKTRDIKTEIKSESATMTTMSKQTGEQQRVFKQEQKNGKELNKMQNPALTQSENKKRAYSNWLELLASLYVRPIWFILLFLNIFSAFFRLCIQHTHGARYLLSFFSGFWCILAEDEVQKRDQVRRIEKKTVCNKALSKRTESPSRLFIVR